MNKDARTLQKLLDRAGIAAPTTTVHPDWSGMDAAEIEAAADALIEQVFKPADETGVRHVKPSAEVIDFAAKMDTFADRFWVTLGDWQAFATLAREVLETGGSGLWDLVARRAYRRADDADVWVPDLARLIAVLDVWDRLHAAALRGAAPGELEAIVTVAAGNLYPGDRLDLFAWVGWLRVIAPLIGDGDAAEGYARHCRWQARYGLN
ncbi:hypothetical protein ABZ342_15255 [Amycolatopsis sp. NPDC005961]|uniref:hypothetical protein n=1 Tax=Amycolatopsis sp. NPDC005961 TaxID=3156720 RepID=UPI0034071243